MDEEREETMTVIEVARLIDALREIGQTDTDICDCIKHIATGMNLPVQKGDL